MKTIQSKLAALLPVLFFSASAYAIPTLQVGAPASGSDVGFFADYIGSTSNPLEADTAITSGGLLYVGGAYGPNDLLIGGQYKDGASWAKLGLGDFGTSRAVLVASMLATEGASLKIDGAEAFLKSSTNKYFPNNHAPLGEATLFLYFDIGDFADTGKVINFATEEPESAKGEVKKLSVKADGFSWVHFDVMALVTDELGTRLVTSVENNPGSHDVTWKNPGVPPSEIPEPATPLLLGLGLLGLFMIHRAHANKPGVATIRN